MDSNVEDGQLKTVQSASKHLAQFWGCAAKNRQIPVQSVYVLTHVPFLGGASR